MEDEPLIYTKLGNMKVSDLDYTHFWAEDDVAISFIEEYRVRGTDEVVRRNAHARLKKGLDSAVEQQLFGTR